MSNSQEIIPLSKRFILNYARRADLFCSNCFSKGGGTYRKWSETEAQRLAAELTRLGWVISDTSAICPACASQKPERMRITTRPR